MKTICYSAISALFLFFTAFLSSASELPEYNLDVSFDIPAAEINGISRIEAKAGREIDIIRGPLDITYIKVNDLPVSFSRGDEIIRLSPEVDSVIEIAFKGVFKDDATDYNDSVMANNVISEHGISLTRIWYPVVEGLHYYRLKAILPGGFGAISEAETIKTTVKGNNVEFSFSFPHPLDSINLMASDRFRLISDRYKDIDLFAYFFEEDLGLARTYIDFTKKYLDMYEDLIGKFPYKRFSIVENFLPTGYSMPTFTLLGSTVVRLPFIVETSLGHEILHQWFGNHVYVDYEKGNWSEGLTTYLSDHLYKARKKKGWEYRKQILIDYRSYVTSENEFPLKDFTGRVDFSSRSIGYGKAAMVFHMMKNLVGEDNFYSALKDFVRENRFRSASWDDLRRSFEKVFGSDLQWFFIQWINRSGMPEIEFHDFEMKRSGSEFELHFHTTQHEGIYDLELPATIYVDSEALDKTLNINEESQGFYFIVPGKPKKIVFDQNYDIARVIGREEFPPVIARLIGEKKIVLALPRDEKKKYQSIIERFQGEGADIKAYREIRDSDIRSSSVVILDIENPLTGRLYGDISCQKGGFCVIIRENPWNYRKVIGIMSGTSKSEVDAAFRKINHYGKYSKLLFENGRNVAKEIQPTQRGVIVEFSENAAAIDISSIKRLSDIIKNVADKKIVYVGEVHDVFAHHAVQLDIIAGIYRRYGKIAIGMEMFQRPFQDVLDSFVAGRMGERDFLKKSEYFQRWGFDYNLYKPILDFARIEKVPVVALNIQREIIDKVSKNGIDSLNEGEKKLIPANLDFSDDKYRKRLEEIFSMHKDNKKDFIHFYQSQILWDETMSHSIDEFLERKPDYKIAVLAGQGHLMYGSGIPKRTYRRNGFDYAIVLIDAKVEKDIADFVVFPKPVEGITAPKLMAFLIEVKEGFRIAGFPDNSVSEKAGLKVGDIILSIDGDEIRSIEDIRIHLLYKERGEIIEIKVLRKEEGKEKEMKFEVEL